MKLRNSLFEFVLSPSIQLDFAVTIKVASLVYVLSQLFPAIVVSLWRNRNSMTKESAGSFAVGTQNRTISDTANDPRLKIGREPPA